MMVCFRTAFVAVMCIGVSAACGDDEFSDDGYGTVEADEQWEGVYEDTYLPEGVFLHVPPDESRLEGPLGLLPPSSERPSYTEGTATDYGLSLHIERAGEGDELGMVWISVPHPRVAADVRVYSSLSHRALTEKSFRQKAAAYGVELQDSDNVEDETWEDPFTCSGPDGMFVDEVPSDDWVVRVAPCASCDEGYEVDFWMWSTVDGTRRDLSGHFSAYADVAPRDDS